MESLGRHVQEYVERIQSKLRLYVSDKNIV